MRALLFSIFFTVLALATSTHSALAASPYSDAPMLRPPQTVMTEQMLAEMSTTTKNESMPTIAVTIPANAGTRVVKYKGRDGKSVMGSESAVDSNTEADALYVSSVQTLKSGYIYSYTWSPCDSSSPFLLQGGFYIDPNVSIVASTRKNSSTWSWTFVNTSGADRNVTLYAVCTHAPSNSNNMSSSTMYSDGSTVSSVPTGKSATVWVESCNSLVSYGFSVKATDGSTSLSGHVTDMYVNSVNDFYMFQFYNSYSKPVKFTATATCIDNLYYGWWTVTYVSNTYTENVHTSAPNSTYTYSRSCTSDKDTLGGGITFDGTLGGDDYDQQQASKFAILGDYFTLSNDFAYWKNRVANTSSYTYNLSSSLACAYDW